MTISSVWNTYAPEYITLTKSKTLIWSELRSKLIFQLESNKNHSKTRNKNKIKKHPTRNQNKRYIKTTKSFIK